MKLIDFIICDDIRREQHSKLSLMGVYNDRIVFKILNPGDQKWPIAIRLATLLRIKISEGEKRPNKFKFTYHLNGKDLISMGAPVVCDDEQSVVTISVSGDGLPIELGTLGFSLSLFRDEVEIFTHTENSAIKITTEAYNGTN